MAPNAASDLHSTPAPQPAQRVSFPDRSPISSRMTARSVRGSSVQSSRRYWSDFTEKLLTVLGWVGISNYCWPDNGKTVGPKTAIAVGGPTQVVCYTEPGL